jgi:hypothetical protein
MEQKMAPGTGLTARQKQLLDLACQEPYIINKFYLSGGTALSYWYLHHRKSDDLYFFSLTAFDYDRLTRWFRQNQKVIGYTSVRFDQDYGFLTVYLHFSDDTILKTDFNHYSETKLSGGLHWQRLEIDSLIDIAVNKVITISTLPRTRDYIDLYFLLTKAEFTLDPLIQKSEKKFKEKIDPLQLVKNFLKISEYTDYPKMLTPFDFRIMIRYYENLAKKLKPEIFK